MKVLFIAFLLLLTGLIANVIKPTELSFLDSQIQLQDDKDNYIKFAFGFDFVKDSINSIMQKI